MLYFLNLFEFSLSLVKIWPSDCSAIQESTRVSCVTVIKVLFEVHNVTFPFFKEVIEPLYTELCMSFHFILQ